MGKKAKPAAAGGKSKAKAVPAGTPMERCGVILAALVKRKDADWFKEKFLTASAPSTSRSTTTPLIVFSLSFIC